MSGCPSSKHRLCGTLKGSWEPSASGSHPKGQIKQQLTRRQINEFRCRTQQSNQALTRWALLPKGSGPAAPPPPTLQVSRPNLAWLPFCLNLSVPTSYPASPLGHRQTDLPAVPQMWVVGWPQGLGTGSSSRYPHGSFDFLFKFLLKCDFPVGPPPASVLCPFYNHLMETTIYFLLVLCLSQVKDSFTRAILFSLLCTDATQAPKRTVFSRCSTNIHWLLNRSKHNVAKLQTLIWV